MGVQVYLLEQQTVKLSVEGLTQEIGTLRRSWKVTEFDHERSMEIGAAIASVRDDVAPVAAMLADVTELTLAREPHRSVAAHLVLGWDSDRSTVTDFGWDYLPVIGYAVMVNPSDAYVLHEETPEGLLPISRDRAVELGIYTSAGQFIRRGQPAIIGCSSVRSYITGYFEADCILSDGRTVNILTAKKSAGPPDTSWYVGKRPSDVARHSEPD